MDLLFWPVTLSVTGALLSSAAEAPKGFNKGSVAVSFVRTTPVFTCRNTLNTIAHNKLNSYVNRHHALQLADAR